MDRTVTFTWEANAIGVDETEEFTLQELCPDHLDMSEDEILDELQSAWVDWMSEFSSGGYSVSDKPDGGAS